MKSKALSLLGSVLCLVFLSGCAVGNKYSYDLDPIPLPVSGDAPVGLVVKDDRPYVLSGDKDPNFIGLQRGGFGNPFNVSTTSGRPMVEEMTATLVRSLEAKGYTVTVLGKDLDLNVISASARASGLNRVIALQIKEWKTDAMMRLTLSYDLKLMLVDSDGEIVAENSVSGSEAISSAGLQKANAESAALEFEKRIGFLFNDPEIVRQL